MAHPLHISDISVSSETRETIEQSQKRISDITFLHSEFCTFIISLFVHLLLSTKHLDWHLLPWYRRWVCPNLGIAKSLARKDHLRYLESYAFLIVLVWKTGSRSKCFNNLREKSRFNLKTPSSGKSRRDQCFSILCWHHNVYACTTSLLAGKFWHTAIRIRLYQLIRLEPWIRHVGQYMSMYIALKCGKEVTLHKVKMM